MAAIVTATVVLAAQSRSSALPGPLGPEVSRLRMGLHITTRHSNSDGHYDVHIRIRNTGPDAITLVGFAPYEGKVNT